MVFQSFNLIPTLTVEENLLLPLELKDGVTAEGRRRALDLLGRGGPGGSRGAASPTSCPAGSSRGWRWRGPLP